MPGLPAVHKSLTTPCSHLFTDSTALDNIQLKHNLFGAENRLQITFRQIHFIMDAFRVPDKTLRCGAD